MPNIQYENSWGSVFCEGLVPAPIFLRWILTRSENPTVSYCQRYKPLESNPSRLYAISKLNLNFHDSGRSKT